MTLAEFWFLAVAVLFTGYFVLEGFDFGVGMLFAMLGRTDTRRRVLLNTIGPVWDGNEVWLITAAGAMFAAFPDWYATMFSGFYPFLLLILVSLIIRVVAIEWRGKINDVKWRARCDLAIMLGSWVPAAIWGIVFANLARGVEVDARKQLTSGPLSLLNPYAVLGGLTFVLLFLLHGTVFTALKTAGAVRTDAVRLLNYIALPVAAIVAGFVLWTQLAYGKPWTWPLAAAAALAVLGVLVLARRGRDGWAFACTTVAVAAVSGLLFAAVFPDVLPSLDPAHSISIASAASSPYTLRVLSWAALFAAPVVLMYQGWTYWVFRQRLSVEHIPPSIGLPAARE
jgi:cytochrome d ubiquinol oxidase subunit II